jgi:hypothetical protein
MLRGNAVGAGQPALARRRVVRGREAECLDFYTGGAAG